ncbi:transposase [Escherichia coli]|nr:transposase [Escherichia coli]MIL09891.1 transposase [Salmonella enterica subsp. enterica serovar Enteritidis]
MPRIARIVVPGIPHHVTQRGNRRERVFFSPDDYRRYSRLLAEAAQANGVEVWCYCLMPNHVHLIVAPSNEVGLARMLGEAHRRYTTHINQREGWTGHLWQGRFGSAPMDEDHLESAVRYVLLNPVRARLVEGAEDWPWSSLHAHLTEDGGGLVTLTPLRDRFPDIAGMLEAEASGVAMNRIRKSETSGRPLGTEAWAESLGATIGKRGRKTR